MLYARTIAVAHQAHLIAVDTDDAVDDVVGTVDPGQYHIAIF